MTLIRIKNNNNRPTIVPARGGFGLVLNAQEEATVCPEGEKGQDTFWSMVSSGVISQEARVRSNVLPFIERHTGDYNKAA